jgi:oxygen-independent coproporphyrinogen-3 oxidase
LRRGNNAPDVRAYIANGTNYREEVLTEQDRYNELIMLGLRTRQGVSFAQLSPYFAAHPDLQKYFERQYGTLLAEKLIQEIPNRSFSLSESGLNLADDVIRRLFYLE